MSYSHDYYVHPTLFDGWQAAAARYLRAGYRCACSYGWGWGFAAVALLCYLSVALIMANAAVAGSAASAAAGWSSSLATAIAGAMALGGGVRFQQLARQALAQPAPIPQARPILSPRTQAARPRPPAGASADASRQLREFFTGVRLAGINVAIARALFSAGIRTPEQVMASSDARLLRIQGVGPATLRRLRHHFRRD